MGQEIIIFISTIIASGEIFFATLILISLDLYRRKEKREARTVCYFGLLLLILVPLFKTLFQIPRPEGGLVMLDSYGFPSGHAAGVILFATILYRYSTHYLHSSKRMTFFVLLILSILVGVSRLYLGVHTPLQVIAGYLLGGTLSLLYYRHLRRINR